MAEKKFLVKTKGFSMQYTDLAKAEAEYAKLKGKKIRNQENFTLTLSERDNDEGDWKVIEDCKISESHYE